MKPKRYARLFPPIVLLLCAAAVRADDDVHGWLVKMNQAARRLDYDGVFVHQHGDQLGAMRIVHKVEQGAVRERLVSLNGAAREIVRNEHEVLCYLPDEKSVVVEHRKADARSFPDILPERLAGLGAHYAMQLGRRERIAGRAAQQLRITPRDPYRYGYRLWADHETGLPLKADLLDDKGRLIEQFMFTHIRIGGPIPAAALAPESPGRDLAWYREKREVAAEADGRKWIVARLPGGFEFARALTRRAPMRNKRVEQLVFSDGLATVSVFVEPLAGDEAAAMQGPSHVGAVHAYGARVNGHQVTAVGEVPAETVALIAKSVAPRR